MKSHRIVKILLGGTHVHGDGYSLHHFIDATAHTLSSNHTLSSITFKVGDQLKPTLGTVGVSTYRHQRVEHVDELARVLLYIFFSELFDGVSV